MWDHRLLPNYLRFVWSICGAINDQLACFVKLGEQHQLLVPDGTACSSSCRLFQDSKLTWEIIWSDWLPAYRVWIKNLVQIQWPLSTDQQSVKCELNICFCQAAFDRMNNIPSFENYLNFPVASTVRELLLTTLEEWSAKNVFLKQELQIYLHTTQIVRILRRKNLHDADSPLRPLVEGLISK